MHTNNHPHPHPHAHPHTHVHALFQPVTFALALTLALLLALSVLVTLLMARRLYNQLNLMIERANALLLNLHDVVERIGEVIQVPRGSGLVSPDSGEVYLGIDGRAMGSLDGEFGTGTGTERSGLLEGFRGREREGVRDGERSEDEGELV